MNSQQSHSQARLAPLRWITAGAFAITLALSVLGGPATSSQAAAASYQYPCSPYRLSGYNFPQYVPGWGYHVGQDVACRRGTPVYATANGLVVYSAKTPDSYRWGNLILIQHFNGDGSQATSIYGHLSYDRRVAAGQWVVKGQLIGFIGPANTAENGNWGDHLHFAIRHGPYNAGVGTYAPGINGYVPASRIGEYADPAAYISRQNQGDSPPPAPPPYDYAPGNVLGNGGTYGKVQEYYIDFQVQNSGGATWKMNGPNPVRLGTIGPNDRASGFSVAMIGLGWASSNRIALIGDTPPGTTGTFRARFTNRAVGPGRYVERFAPVVDGVGWLPDKGITVVVNVLPPRHAAQWYSQAGYTILNPTNTSGATDHTFLLPGQKLNLKAYIRNVGDEPWRRDGPNPVRLGTARANDRPSAFATGGDGSIPLSENWPAYNRPSSIDGRYNPGPNSITAADVINPGEIAVFSFTITVPNRPGDHIEYFNPVMEGRGWLNDIAMWFRLRILPPGYHYEYAGQTNPPPAALGRGAAPAALYIRNLGQRDWPVGGGLRLGTDRPRDRASNFRAGNWPAGNRAAAIDVNLTNPGKAVINPGEVARFSISFDNQSAPDGIYPEYVRPLMEGQEWLPEDYGIFFPVTVQSPAYDYLVVDQRFTKDISQLHYGDQFNVLLAIKNLGNRSWQTAGSNPIRLGTERRRDRASGFSILAGLDPWLSVNRATTIDNRVTNLNPYQTVPATEIRQGEVGQFAIPIRVPPGLNPGPYHEYFNLVADGTGWLPDYGIYFPFTVVGP